MATHLASSSSSDGMVVFVKNTFLEVEDSEPCAATARKRRFKTLPLDFGSSLLAELSAESTDEGDVESVSSSCSQTTSSLAGRVWTLSQDAQGCREVQDALGDCSLGCEHKEALAGELCGHVLEAAVCPYSNYVLQKCVVALRPQAIQFVVDEIPADSVSAMSQNKFGCRVLQRLFERCEITKLAVLVEAVLADFITISRSPYGNYVVQKLLCCSKEIAELQQRAAHLIELAVGELGGHPFGCIVLSSALSVCSSEARLAIARAMLKDAGLLGSMARTRHGHRTVLTLLGVLIGKDLELAQVMLRNDDKLSTDKYSRAILASLN